MKALVCKVCGHVEFDGAPEKCPVCGAPKSAFLEKEDAIKEPKDAANKTDLEKKHIPVIVVLKKCGLIEGCVDVHTTMGEILHPMQADHSIQWIDFYLDKKFFTRVTLDANVSNPAAGLHLKAASGTLTVVEFCNLHGVWSNEVKL